MFNTQKPPLGARIVPGHPMANGLVGCWLMNEGDGNIICDLSDNGHNGTLTSGITWGSEYLDIGDTASGIPTTMNGSEYDEISIVFRCMLPSVISSLSYPFDNSPGIVGYGARFDLYEKLNFFCYSGGDPGVVVQIAAYNAGQVYDYVCMHAHGGNYIYIDGLYDSYTANGTGIDAANDTLTIGDRTDSPGSAFEGYLYHLMVYNRALTPSEINSLHIDPYAMFRDDEIWKYGAGGWTGKICGVTNPSKVCGVPTSDIGGV